MPDQSLLSMEGISKSFYGNQVIHSVDLRVEPGQVRALLGENGAGKSTLMNILFGMPVIVETGGYEGRIRFKGREVSFRSPTEAMAAGIGMVHQEFMLLPGFTVAENIKLNREPVIPTMISRVLGPGLGRLDIPKMREDARQALASVGTSIDEWAPVAGLPVGHKQFVEIAREIDKSEVSLLVLDEPTAVLSESESGLLLDAVRRLAGRGIGVLFITHRLSEVLGFADVITMLRDGKVVGDTRAGHSTLEELASLMVGRPYARTRARRREIEPSGDRLCLQIRGLEVDMPGESVRGLDLDVREGEILGIGGLAGQGKACIANGLMGLVPARGRVTRGKRPVVLNNPRASLDAGFSFLSEDRRSVGLMLDEPVELNIGYSLLVYRRKMLAKGVLGALGRVDWHSVRALAERMIDDLDIRCQGSGQVVRRLSGGNQQKVCFARAISLNPDVLLVSEPTRGIDIGAKEKVLELIVEANGRGVTVIATSSDLSELRRISDRVAIVYGGKIAGILPPDTPDVEFGLIMAGGAVSTR